jgi:hypothetical protein
MKLAPLVRRLLTETTAPQTFDYTFKQLTHLHMWVNATITLTVAPTPENQFQVGLSYRETKTGKTRIMRTTQDVREYLGHKQVMEQVADLLEKALPADAPYLATVDATVLDEVKSLMENLKKPVNGWYQ